jgi:hypothetical protein
MCPIRSARAAQRVTARPGGAGIVAAVNRLLPPLLALVLAVVAAPLSAQALVFYDDAPRAGLQDWSWTTHDLANTSPVHAGIRSIRMEPDFYGGVYLNDPAVAHRVAQYGALTFWVHGGSGGGQALRVLPVMNGLAIGSFAVADYVAGGAIVAGQWREVTIPFDAITTLTHGGFEGLIVMGDANVDQAAVYLDDIAFQPRGAPLPSTPITVSVDLGQDRRAIDPNIYGVNFGDDAQHADLRYPLRRFGGNSTTRVNWQVDNHNTAFDYFYQNIADGDGSGLPGNNAFNRFADATRAQGGEALLTVPTIGWLPRADRVKRWGYSIIKYGPQDQNECSIYDPVPPWCSADAGNGECENVVNNTGFCVNGRIVNNDPLDTSFAPGGSFGASWTTGWLNHLVGRYGPASAGGIRYYALDNEPMLWNSTHRDVHPTPPTYDEIWNRGRTHAAAIKAADPGALVMGPVTWGWCDLFTSAADAAIGPSCIDGPDRQAHGGLPFVEWYLQQAQQYQQANGVRLIDFLDVHYYPQGRVTGLGGPSDSELPEDAARRLRSLKELYDPTWLAEPPSWLGDIPRLIPRLREWIAARYPGTRIAVTEYKWGADDGPSGALAQAEVLAIFGREGVDLATRWIAPDPGSLSERAFRLFLDYDGSNTRVLGDSVRATSPNPDELGAYAVHRTGQRLYVLLFNKATLPRDVTVNVSAPLSGAWQAYRFDAVDNVGPSGSGAVNGTSLTLNGLPGRSATLLILPNPGAGGDLLFANGFEN